MTETVQALQELAVSVARFRITERGAAAAIARIDTVREERVVSMSAVEVQSAIRRGAALAAGAATERI